MVRLDRSSHKPDQISCNHANLVILCNQRHSLFLHPIVVTFSGDYRVTSCIRPRNLRESDFAVTLVFVSQRASSFGWQTLHVVRRAVQHDMPRENKKRGRRMESNKRKHEDGDDDSNFPEANKRRKSTDADGHEPSNTLSNGDDGVDAAYPAVDKPFFGMLDDDEQEYFRSADQMLESNSFSEPEGRDIFLRQLYRDAEGKELKIANSQSCSRLMERLIQLSTPSQLRGLFQSFNGK